MQLFIPPPNNTRKLSRASLMRKEVILRDILYKGTKKFPGYKVFRIFATILDL